MHNPSALRAILDKHFSPFHFYIDRSRKVVLVLNPKVASTFLRKILTEAHLSFLGRNDASDGRYRHIHMARRMPVASISDYFHFLNNPQEYEVFSIVRNPFDRAISAWKDKFYDGHVSGYARSMRDGELAKARKFAARHSLAGAKDGELFALKTFISYVVSEPNGKRNHHWDRQKDVLLTENINYTRTFKIETEMAEALTTVLDTTKVPRQWILDKTARPMNASSKSSVTYGEDVVSQLIDVYRDDFKFFGYSIDECRKLHSEG